MLTANFGVVVGLALEYGMIGHEFVIASTVERGAVAVFILLTFSAIWLAASGPLIRLGEAFRSSFASWVVAFFLALFGTFVLVPLKRVVPKIGSGVGLSVFFNAVACSALVFFAGSRIYLPWGILPVILFELALWRLAPTVGFKNATLLSSLLMGVFFGEVYYPFTVYLFPWSFSLQPQVLSPLVGSVAGAYLGNRVYSALSSAMLSGVTASL
jgi:hypothetical protein